MLLWVPRTLSRRLISAFATSHSCSRSPNPGQHDHSEALTAVIRAHGRTALGTLLDSEHRKAEMP
jgi:hypothetical protein